jgi:hypothetical protein
MSWFARHRQRLIDIAISFGSGVAVALLTIPIADRCTVVRPQLGYTTASWRMLVYDDTFAPAVSLTHNAETLREPVYRLTVFVWNLGRKSITGPYYQPTRLTLNPPVRVLSAKVVRATAPDICRFRIENVDRERGTMALTWNVLETGDGAAIDIIYTGNRWTEPRIDGAFEGQRTLQRYGFARRGLIGLALFLVIGSGTFIFAPTTPFWRWERISMIVIFIVMLLILSHTLVYGVPGAIDVGP